MTKKEFILKYVEKSQHTITIKEAVEDIEILLQTLTNLLISQKKVSFFRKGTFELFERKSRIIGNPATNGTILLPAEKAIRFKPSPLLNRFFNNL